MCRLALRAAFALALLSWIAGCARTSSESQKFVVYFEQWSAALDQPAHSAINAAAKRAQEHPDQIVTVAGYADPQGSQQANIEMSRARAKIVADQLVQDGVSRQRIRLSAHGATDYSLSSIESRRVEIAVGS